MSEDEWPSRSDIHLMKTAIRQRWPMTDEMRAQILRRLERVLEESRTDRSVVAAARALIDVDRVNQEQEIRDEESENSGPVEVIVRYAHRNLPTLPPSEPSEDPG